VKKSVGVIIYFKNRYLIQKRSLKKNIYFPGIFGVFGGNVNKSEKVSAAVIREIHEELNIKLSFKQIKSFLNISINSQHFKKNRRRYFFSVKITKNQLDSIILKEGDSFKLFNLGKIKTIKFVPWDLAAILYFEYYIKSKKSVKPKQISN
jgi:8-oxo-dGTP pyrophosphatase MutT (NUDIX family)